MMTLQNVILAITIGGALMSIAGAAYAIAKWLDREDEPADPDPQSEMYAAFQRYCDALDEAALDGDTARYDAIKKVGWRKFGVDAA